jgi:CTP synthase
MTTKYIFVTGGVVSSIGKGICVASIGRILKSRGLSVSVVKLDPYLNVDPGTMSPYQHGEVFVTKDGGETDLDLGHYERFIDVDLTRSSNLTAGQVYMTLIAKERRGDFLGGTIQTVPHVTNEIKAHLAGLAGESQVDVVVVEVGGTVGDIEGLPFLEAIRQMRKDVGRNNVCYVHLTLLPFISGAEELKTKPTQHSVKELRSIGIQPDALICRSDYSISDSIREKLSLFCDVDGEAVIPLETVDNVYEVPLILEDAGLGDYIVDLLNLEGQPQDLSDWSSMVDRMRQPKGSLPIAIVGKYVEYPDSYLSVREALRHAGTSHDQDVEIKWVHSEHIERDGPEIYLKDVRGIVVPGGFGQRGVEGMIDAVHYAREANLPYLGLCLGMQVMVIDWARHVLGLEGANSSELDPDTPHPVIHIMPEQEAVTDMGGTMRLGVYPCRPLKEYVDLLRLPGRGDRRAAPAPVRGEQSLPGEPGGIGDDHGRPFPRRQAGGNGRGLGPSLYGRGAVPSGIPFPTQSPPPPVLRVYRPGPENVSGRRSATPPP